MSISPARTIAFDVLRRVASQGAFADECLRVALLGSVRTEDAALATELTMGVLRWQRLLDFLINQNLAKKAKALDVEVQIALRLGVYQLSFLHRVPAHAAVNESVELVKRARKRSAAPLVNAILRKAAKERSTDRIPSEGILPSLSTDLPTAERLGIQYSHPTWLVERWLRIFGEEGTQNLLATNNSAPAVSVCVLNPGRREIAAESLRKAGCVVQPGVLLRNAWTLERGNPAASEAIEKGWVAVQDEASQAVAHLVGVEPGNSVLDTCAAPGGKTLLLSIATGPQGHVTAGDLHAHRVRAMRERFERAGARNIECVILDGTKALPFEDKFDRVLVDAPCSGTGTLARQPEIRWRLRVEDLEDLHARQVQLLRSGLLALAPGGRLVYSTCSLEPEENECVVNEVLSKDAGPFHIATPGDLLRGLLREGLAMEMLTGADGFLRTFPPDTGTDGFFAAVIEPRT